ncbi:endo-alpha-N-acetylgalactosaminidase family protein [Faecalimonas sp.]
MKKRNLKVLSLLLVASMTVPTVAAPTQYLNVPAMVQAADENSAKAGKETASADGIHDKWDEQNKVGNDSVCAVENGWLHLKSGAENGNNPGTKPAMFVNPTEFDFNKAGFFEFTMKSNNANKDQNTSDRFGIYLGYNTDKNGMFVGYDNGGWFWQKYKPGTEDYYQGTREAAPTKGSEVKVNVSWTADHKMTLKLGDKVVFDKIDFSGIQDQLGNKIAFKAGSFKSNSVTAKTDVFLKDIHYTGQKAEATYDVTGKVVDAKGQPVADATVKVGEQTVKTDAKGNYTLKLKNGTHSIEVTKEGVGIATGSVTVNGATATVTDITLSPEAEVETEKISSTDMDVFVAKHFPSVAKYVMKDEKNNGKVFYGQTKAIDTIKINDVAIKLEKNNVKATFAKDKATYEMNLKTADGKIDAVITAELKVKKNELHFDITKVENKLLKAGVKETKDNAIQTIEIPNHSLISVRSTQTGANLKGALMSSNTTISGDEFVEVNDKTPVKNQDYMYAFVSNNELSAGLWSNSENEGSAKAVGVAGGSHNTRVMATTQKENGYVTTGLGSTKWYYHRAVESAPKKNANGSLYKKDYVVEETEMPSMKIAIAGNINGDENVDWQDGAVAFREIMHNPKKSEEVPELVAWRIAMNFGGQAQNPFLTTLDNVKRVAMHTDGLGQSVLLKGYGSEGHDSGHPDYADIGKRIGGAKDMNTLMEKGKKYGARFGIHVNAGEMYPEAKAFTDDSVRRDEKGNLRYGWNWLDQGVGLDSVYDLGEGHRRERFNDLNKKVENMDFVYVDIWGNKTGGSDDSWQTRKLSKEINDNGWRMATEWGSANEYDSTFQHWATDLTYGGFELKGENSEVMRFLRNHQKDSWVGDYPSYGGAAMAPLLGGYNMKDFEGWQGRNDYDAYIRNLYTHDLTTKFIQHFKVMDWENGNEFTKNDPKGKAYKWTPEMKITLKGDMGELVLQRGSDNPDDVKYRERTMTLNGKVIATGAVSRGDNGKDGTESYLVPWNWDAETGKKVVESKEKLYHWNTKGGTTTWELQDNWKNLKDVKVYELTDLGKVNEKTVPVVGGKITLKAEAQTPYVVCRGKADNLNITWSEGMHIVDAGFNTGDAGLEKYWTKAGDGKATIAKSQFSNPMLKLEGKVAMTQELTGLKAGQKYAVLVGVDNRSNAKASVTVKSGDKVLDSNYTTKSIAKNYVKAYTHSNASATVDGTSYFQNMYVYFTAPENGKVTLTLAKEAGEESAYFDDVRVTETTMDVVKKDKDGNVVGMKQDFEDNVQGVYPFVIGAIEGVEDNRTHLSELHDKYTQAGWDVKKMDDVLTKNDPKSNWSVKTNGLCQRGNLVMQTIPQNFRFEEGKTYKVSFDYQSGSDGIYGVVVGNGEVKGSEKVTELEKAMGSKAEKTHQFEITGAAGGQTWFGIYSTTKAPDLQGTKDAAANFGGYQDFVLDNLKIEEVKSDVSRADLEALVKEAEQLKAEDYLPADWKVVEDALTNAKVVLNKNKQSQEEIEKAYYKLKGAMESLKYAGGTETDARGDIATDKYTVEAGSFQPDNATEGDPKLAQDNKADTFWHTNWNDANIDKAWYQFNFKEPQTVNGMRYLPRPGAANVNGKLKKVDVQISTDNAKTWKTVSDDAQLSTNTVWQKIKFDKEYTNVTNVKLIAVETVGNKANQFAAAAELRVTKPFTPEKPVVDKTGLAKAIAEAEKLVKENYTEDSWNNMAKYLDAARKVNAKADATQYDVELAIANLGDAVKDLVAAEKPQPSKPDTSKLEEAIQQAGKYNEKDYTADSWKNFQAALKHAKDVLGNKDAKQADIDAATSALNIAIEGLVKADSNNNGGNTDGTKPDGTNPDGTKPDGTNPVKPVKPAKPDGAKPAKPNKPVKTGDEAPVLPLTATVAGLGAAIALLFKKRK